MTAWFAENSRTGALHIAMPNSHGMPCYLLDEHAQPVLVDPAPPMSGGDRQRYHERLRERFDRVDQVFQQLIRRYG